MRPSTPAKTGLRRALALGLLVSVGGCSDEGLNIVDLNGTIVVPREAATQTFSFSEGDRTITDVRLIGPVYVGLYSQLRYDLEAFPHPHRGPQFQVELGRKGDAYPYGGTTAGDIRFGCLEFLNCKVVSGRHVDFDSLVDWFADQLDDPITDAFGEEVKTGEYIRQTCYEILEITSDAEIRITVTADENGDGELNELDLQFVENADGDFEAEFTLLQQEFFDGMVAWGWMDAPQGTALLYDTCNSEEGQQQNEYNAAFRAGLQPNDVLNHPYLYIKEGDFVASEGYTWTNPEAPATLVMDFENGVDDVVALRESLDDGGGE